MGFIDPKTDFGFKRIFASPNSRPILKSLLNALIYDGQLRIQDLEILDPYQQPEIPDFKLSILDVKAQLDDGSTVIIEMQVAKVEAFIQRILYNTTKAYASQLGRGKYYWDLRPVIAVTITDFILFDDPEVDQSLPISRFSILNEETHALCTSQLRWIFVELPKFGKDLVDLEGLVDRWLFFLQRAGELQQAPPELTSDHDLQSALDIANESQLSPAELRFFEAELDRLRVMQGQIFSARDEGLAEGLAEGRAEGLAAGRAEGITLGAKQRELEIARELLKTLDPETVSRVTGLSIEQVQDLAQADDP
ncbi:Rpn family recombination-promoting nuclease/putative transposase [Limnothrix sp. FACHB-708]|uniref:Rpn family recombination-promoting nuclease/putative transposase n=1 Tax=unclassified Limnothrix TaxID=2632864 RepID=UPI00168512A1|nr:MULTISPECIES: Rpn family recombination-promoting nuclease/putative transposase [unclassified Limnothrix]MBD2554117.1 Rpn family recombination-promoting nuclease/putative transposase [Limnothrix sp. FACHB-708]MBD2590999.1 Rpn family recombination-promoting nuclease/putative transposase [Limnothrix sp. FACHB-406]